MAAKRVESFRVPCLDAGSTPATSTENRAFMRKSCNSANYGIFFLCSVCTSRQDSERVYLENSWELQLDFPSPSESPSECCICLCISMFYICKIHLFYLSLYHRISR